MSAFEAWSAASGSRWNVVQRDVSMARAPEDGPGVAETTARLMRDLEPAPLAAALLADRFSYPLGAVA